MPVTDPRSLAVTSHAALDHDRSPLGLGSDKSRSASMILPADTLQTGGMLVPRYLVRR